MFKKIVLILITASFLVLESCKSPLDTNIGFDIKGTWQLYETCVTAGCLPTDPNEEVTIEFREDDLVEKQNNQVIGAAEYVVGEIQNDNVETLYLLFVNDNSWRVTVTETTLDILVGFTFRRYNKVD